jgi:hypothetical protein
MVEVLHYRPAISIIIPFEPKMGLKAEIKHAINQMFSGG